MPTKTEQSDLLMAIHGRHGESPLPVVAASTPGQCFEAAYEAARIAVRYRTPVILLSDLFLANSSEPWRIPDAGALPPIDPDFAEATDEPFEPYARDEHGARPWAIPGTPGLAHRIGGLEKRDVTGDISYDGANHAHDDARARRQGARRSPPTCRRSYVDADPGAELLVLGWGSSRGAIRAAARRVRTNGHAVAIAHLHHLHPLPDQPRRGAAPLRARAGAGDEHRPARAAPARRVPGQRRQPHASSRASRCSRPSSSA